MIVKSHRRLAFGLAVGLAGVIGASGVAFGAGAGPTLVSPHRGERVHAGAIRLVVRDTSAEANTYKEIDVTISRHRRLNRQGFLIGCGARPNTASGCDYLNLHRWAHHPGDWTVIGGFDFPGYWAVTPGRYYWQAVQTGANGLVGSRIGSFRVVG